jgi:hypothetical protein
VVDEAAGVAAVVVAPRARPCRLTALRQRSIKVPTTAIALFNFKHH